MNKNKIIFAILAGIILVLIIAIVMIASAGSERTVKTTNTLQVWTVGHETSKFSEVIKEFSEDVPAMSGTTFSHINFDSYNDYQEALLYAIANNEGPDIFMLNNTEQAFLSNSVLGILGSEINLSEFRKNYFPVFSDELIKTEKDADGNDIDYLLGVPAGYEVLGLYYDRRKYLGKKLNSWTNVGNAITDLKEKNATTTPLALGHGTSITHSSDIFAQFAVQDGAQNYSQLDQSGIRSIISEYQRYGSINGQNEYERNLIEGPNKTDLQLFSEGEVSMIIGFPSTIKAIDALGVSSKRNIQVSPFPKSLGGEDNLLIRYNYFVIRADTGYRNEAKAFLAYLASDEGAEEYYEAITNVIPARTNMLSSLQERKIDERYEITPFDFLRDGATLVSYDKGISRIYDERVPYILNDKTRAVEQFQELQADISCKIQKIGTKNAENKSCN